MKALILILCFISTQAWALPVKNEVLFAYSEIPPFSGYELESEGIMNKILVKAFAREGIKVSFIQLPFSRILERLKKGSITGASVLWYTKERSQYIAYSKEIMMTQKALFSIETQEIGKVKDKNFLKDKTVSFTRGYAKPKVLLESKSNFKELKVNNDIQAFKLLRARRVDYVFTGRKSGLFTLNKSKIIFQNLNVKVLDEEWIYFGFSKIRPLANYYRSKLNDGLEKMRLTGELEKILLAHNKKYKN